MTKMSKLEEHKKQFFDEAPKIHNSYYDYSKVDFMGRTKKVIIICLKHGEFLQEARSHLKYGCSKCGKDRKKMKEIEERKRPFLDEASKIHNGYYDYSKVVFTGKTKKVIVICPKHGEFLQEPRKHLEGQGCNHCGVERTANIQRKSLDTFIKQSKEIHGEDHYNYNNVKYINDHTKVDIYCNICEKIFQQKPSHHLKGCGCNDCGIEKRSIQKIEIASFNFWKVANEDELFDFSKFKYKKSRMNGDCICKKCNIEFPISPNNYLRGKGCPTCRNKTEGKLYKELKTKYNNLVTKNIRYEWCRNTKKKNCYLPFDFCIEEYKTIIELDGIQHFQNVKHYRNTIEEQREIDLYKQKCANDNGYSMIRIYQEDVWNDTFDWLNKLCETIEKIKYDKYIQNIYISKNDKYNDFENVDNNSIIT